MRRSEQRKKAHIKSQVMYEQLKTDESEEVVVLNDLPESTRVLSKSVNLDESDDNDDDLYFEDID